MILLRQQREDITNKILANELIHVNSLGDITLKDLRRYKKNRNSSAAYDALLHERKKLVVGVRENLQFVSLVCKTTYEAISRSKIDKRVSLESGT